jgi:hypothetical protein
MSKKYIACPQCGQNMNLSPDAVDELAELKEDRDHWRTLSLAAKEALEKILLIKNGPDLWRAAEQALATFPPEEEK